MQITTNHLLLLKQDQKIWNISSFASILLKSGIIMFWLTFLSKMSLDTRYSKNTKWDIQKKNTDRYLSDVKWCRPSVFIVNFEHPSHLFLVFSISDFEQVIVRCDIIFASLCSNFVTKRSCWSKLFICSECFETRYIFFYVSILI